MNMENAVWAGLAAHQWAEPELRKIEADLAALDWLTDYLFTINSKRAGFNLTADELIARPQLLSSLLFAHGMHYVPAPQERAAALLYLAGWTYQSKVRMNRYIDELSARIDPVQRRWFAERPVPSSVKNFSGVPEAVFYLVFNIFGGDLGPAEQRYLYLATNTDEARLACALERFRLVHGSYPATLAALAPDFIPAIPVEIVNGEPYHYRLTDDGNFLLYSVGMDLHDDGGAPGAGGRGQYQLDWVWRYPGK
jgi:hypothetical protein